MAQSGSDPKVRVLLEKSDKAVDEANRQSNVVAPKFQELLAEFDRLGLAKFRAEKREACQEVIDQDKAIGGHLQEESKFMVEATQFGTETKITEFLMPTQQPQKPMQFSKSPNVRLTQCGMTVMIRIMN